jgi:hypothetical protein
MQHQWRRNFIDGLISAAAAMLTSEAERAAESFEKTALPDLAIWLPIFFRRRKRKPQQVSWRGEQTTAHAQAKHGALE